MDTGTTSQHVSIHVTVNDKFARLRERMRIQRQPPDDPDYPKRTRQLLEQLDEYPDKTQCLLVSFDELDQLLTERAEGGSPVVQREPPQDAGARPAPDSISVKGGEAPPVEPLDSLVSLEVVVNGQPALISVAGNLNVRGVIEPALERTGTTLLPESEWEVRLRDGDPLMLDQPLKPFVGQRLWINLRAGYCASRGPAQAQGWQPISTAPKDGTRVLTCNSRRVALSWFDDDPDFLVWANTGVRNPTHWMPLPSPPSPPTKPK